jgi:uncharacterized membrane protein
MARLRIVATVLVLVGYALLSHLLMARWPDRPWTVALLFGPLLAGLALAGLARRHLPSLAGCVLLAAVLAYVVHLGGVGVNLLYVLQHAAIHGLLALTFGLTLRAGAQPLITQVAERVHDVFPPVQRAYTRWLTAVWTVYFAGMIALSLLIYLLAPWPVWSLFCNVITPAAAVALFVGEHVLRYWRHPEFERVTMQRVVRAYQSYSASR